jgi:heme-degrading monooxygenase HmoA
MYARTTRILAARDRIDAGTRQFRETMAEFHGLDGFLGGQFLVDRRTGRVVATTFWQTEAAMIASDAHAEDARLRATETWGATVSPSVERYEVAYSELRPAASAGA